MARSYFFAFGFGAEEVFVVFFTAVAEGFCA